MYFIARNNKIYNYIAHMSSLYRYCFIMGIVGMMIGTWLYCVYYPLQSYQLLYEREYNDLQKKHEERFRLEQSVKDSGVLIDAAEKTIKAYVLPLHDVDTFFKENLLFVLDLVTQSGLILHSYGAQKIKDKKWYKKNSAHLDVAGSFESCMNFIKLIHQSQKMITISSVSLIQSDHGIYRMTCDVGFVVIESSL
jgi:hypothetical protein